MKDACYTRRATAEDIPYITDVSLREVPKMPHYAGVRMSRAHVERFLTLAIIDYNTYLVSVLISPENKPVGFGVAYCVPLIFSDEKASHDIFLYIEPPWRSFKNAGKAYKMYKDWAVERGATLIGASHTAGYESDAMDLLLRRHGFERIGATYHARR